MTRDFLSLHFSLLIWKWASFWMTTSISRPSDGLLEFLEARRINKPLQWHLLCEVIIAFE